MFFNPQLESFAYKITNTTAAEHVPEHHLGYTGLAPARDIGDDVMCAEHHHKLRRSEKTYLGDKQNVHEDEERLESVNIEDEISNENKNGSDKAEISKNENGRLEMGNTVDIETEKTSATVAEEVNTSEKHEDFAQERKIKGIIFRMTSLR